MKFATRLLSLVSILAMTLALLPGPRAAADTIGPADVLIHERSLYDERARRHPSGAVLLSGDREQRTRLFVPEGRGTSPRLVWRYDLTLLRVYGRATVVNLKVAGRWYTFRTDAGDAVAEYDLEQLGALDDLERIEVQRAVRTRPSAGSGTWRPVQPSRRVRGPRIHIDLGFFLKFGKHGKHKDQAGAGGSGSSGGQGAKGGKGAKVLPGLPPMVPGDMLKDMNKGKSMPGIKFLPKQAKMLKGKFVKIFPSKQGSYPGIKFLPKRAKMLKGRFVKIFPSKQSSNPGIKFLPKRAKMVKGKYVIVPAAKTKNKVVRMAPPARGLINRFRR